MKITFENTNTYTNRARSTEFSQAENKITGQQAFIADITDSVRDNDAYKVHGRTMQDVMQEAQSIDVAAQTDYLTVMSHSMSGEDFGKMLEEGVDPASCDIDTSVTIMDKIKVEVAKSGVTVAGFNDDIDPEILKEVTGSEAYAKRLVSSLKNADVPATKDNVKEADEAVKRAMELTPLTEGELKYMVLNNLAPTLDNFYLAKHSGAVDANRQSKGYFAEGNGYLAKKAEEIDTGVMNDQVTEILESFGTPATEEALADGAWMIEKGIPLTSENYKSLVAAKSVDLPMKEEEAISHVVTAMSDFHKAAAADLTETEDKYKKAANLDTRIAEIISNPNTSLHDRRVLEETRLKMTSEVNLKLVESGFSIDTSDLEELVEALKAAEESVAKRYFPDDDTEKALENKAMLDKAVDYRNSLYEAPASALGSLVFTKNQPVTLEGLAEEGIEHKKAYELANSSYEKLMTSPRADLGDSMRKAFRNVDDILEDLGVELTDRNRKGVRILAYNHVEINEENIEKVVKADRMVNRVVERMTPVATLKMIRDGVNPLKTSFEELEAYLKDQNENPEKQMETYSRFLYRLEQSGDITEEERSSYIGIYRMLRQIEKSDGAVIGSVLEANRELNFANLLSAARIAKKSGMDILVDDSFGGLKDLVYKDTPIDVQVSAGDSGENNLYNQTAENLKETAKEAFGDEEISEILKNADLAPTIPHIKEALEGKVNTAKSWSKVRRFAGDDKLGTFADSILEAFTGRDEAREAYETLSEGLQEEISSKLYDESMKSLDIQEMKSSHIFLSVAVGMARQETYEIPVSDEGISSIRLTIRHDKENAGNAFITLHTEDYGDVSVSLDVSEKEAGGFLIGRSDVLPKMESLNETLNNMLKEDDISFRNLLYTREFKNPTFESEDETNNISTARIYGVSRTVVEALRQVFSRE